MSRWLAVMFMYMVLPSLGEDGSCTQSVDADAEFENAQALLQSERRSHRTMLQEEQQPLAGSAVDGVQELTELEPDAGDQLLTKDGKTLTKEEADQEAIDKQGPGDYEPLTEVGYQNVAAYGCNYQMEEFIRRVIDDLGLELCGEGGLMGMVPYYSTEKGPRDYASLRQELVDKVHTDCPIASTPGACPADDSNCAGSGVDDPGYHRRRSCAKLTTTSIRGDISYRTTTAKLTAAATTVEVTTVTTTTATTTEATTTTATTTVATTTTATTLTTTPGTTPTVVTTTSTGCRGTTEVLDFFNSKLEHSNLGGAGPDLGEQNMRFEGIGAIGGKPFDMVVSATSAYVAANNLDNGFECGQPTAGCVNGRFAQVNVATGTSVDLTVSFEDSETQAAVTLNKFLFSFHDIDQFSNTVKERVYITGFIDEAIVDNATDVGVRTEADGRTRLTSTKDGTSCDTPLSPMSLDTVECSGVLIDQRKRSAAFVFENVASIDFTLEVTADVPGAAASGRSFLFTGDTNLVTCPGRPGF